MEVTMADPAESNNFSPTSPASDIEETEEGDNLRVHSQDPAEGADPADDREAEPRVHAEEPSEG
jgi:hypothetical protein